MSQSGSSKTALDLDRYHGVVVLVNLCSSRYLELYRHPEESHFSLGIFSQLYFRLAGLFFRLFM
jgi:hypothetical protein